MDSSQPLTVAAELPVEDPINFRAGKVGPLAESEPLLHIEVFNLLHERREHQKKWCLDLQRLGIHRGQSESFTHWEQHQAPIVHKCYTYTGVGVAGVGQKGGTSQVVLNRWAHLKLELSTTSLEIRHQWHVDPTTDPVDYLTKLEITQLCNLLPADDLEAKTIIPSLERFTETGINKVCAMIQTVENAPYEG
eukprot:TRINITY_DN17236_c0_g1_i1.p1 TRINITY_DN17236_c0_g1~~TRINITY_DN17236_c0_g1_i1.p1  ORF type:complete len:192 (+),score=55.10 TRINITY_DN17236_c0_g1_i1:47-622(+)